ncbi:hypothetical protein VPH35_014434 [Triticum aestivum]|uniref:uncharacterized protein n=1 Tax=Triticum aestivum TaxID=4565 RepID=UPI000989ECB2|nr:uncharacterized protein LOC123181298 [Triticum aestivum]
MAPPALNLAGSGRLHAKSAENGSTPARSARIRPGLLPYDASSRSTTAAPCQPRSSRSSPPNRRHCRRTLTSGSPKSFPKSYKRLRLDEPLTKTHLYSEFLLAKMDHQLQNMLAKLSQVWSRPRKSQFKSSRRRGMWRFPPPVAALLVFVACCCQIQHDLSYRFSIASLCFMCICAENMTTRPCSSPATLSLMRTITIIAEA